MKYPPRRHHQRAHVSRAQPYTTTQYRIAWRLRRSNVWSSPPTVCGPPQVDSSEAKDSNYGEDFVGDYGEENACQNHPELEQRMNQILEIARVQSKQIHDMDKTTRELVQQMREVVQQVRELRNNLVEKILLPLFQAAETVLQGEQDQVRHGVTGEHATMDPVEMSTKGSEPRR
ncbi:hypothetical protein BGZ61DRAFT_460605 [Ilyonectria robusta]|uniref:uncharacterized protein n=1 Tax=Ilyonectria robusta TaxID=1079257 RepID=UPI001E8E52A3|nr:uncharacterized protein BGZ61DRAFT_460605 [Ilyonectria robusta]KAH8669226.1 hypothetical protein BGZ61DRAFT_460605 [Ilyonectria robusta]